MSSTISKVFKFNPITHEVIKPTLLLRNRSFSTIGSVVYSNLKISISATNTDEISFDVYKYIDGAENPIWDKLWNHRIIDIVGYKQFDISLNSTEEDDVMRTVTGTSLECELSSILIFNGHYNDDDYLDYMSDVNVTDENLDAEGNIIPIKFYNPTDTKHSLLHLLLEKSNWSVGHVDSYLTVIDETGNLNKVLATQFQRTFTFDNTSIADALIEVCEEANALVFYDTYNRTINVYDKHSYGEDTNVLINRRNLANSIQIDDGADKVINTYYVCGGDDTITNWVPSVNITGNYIYRYDNQTLADMPTGLADAINSYQIFKNEYKDDYYGGYTILTDAEEAGLTNVPEYLMYRGTVVSMSSLPVLGVSIGDYYYVEDVAKYYGYNKDSQWVKVGAFIRLCSAYDYYYYLHDGMFPNTGLKKTTAAEQASKLQTAITSAQIGISTLSTYTSTTSFTGITNNVVAWCKTVIDSRYTLENVTSIDSNYPTWNPNSQVWTGQIHIYRTADTTDTVTITISTKITDDEVTYVKDKIMKMLSSADMYDMDHVDVTQFIEQYGEANLPEFFAYYNLTTLKSYYDGYESCLSILMAMSDESSAKTTLYNSYVIRRDAVKSAYLTRVTECDDAEQLYEKYQNEVYDIQATVNFKTYLDNIDPSYWKLLNSYRREQQWTGENYVSDGLDSDGEIVKLVQEMLAVAEYELSIACRLNRSLSIDLNNLLAMPEFETFWDKFDLYNYIRIYDSVTDETLKLQIAQVDVDFENIDSLDVTFVENVGEGNVMSDLESTLEQASAVSASFPSVSKQASQGENAQDTVSTWIADGLNASLTALKNSDNEEVTINNYGILLKSMTENGNWGNTQFRLTGNQICFTEDDWHSVELAMGRIKIGDTYSTGLIAKNVIGELLAGNKLLITNSSGSVEINGDQATFTDIAIDYENSTGEYVHIGDTDNGIFTIGCTNSGTRTDALYFSTSGATKKLFINGNITAKSGLIGGWTIGDSSLYNGTIGSSYGYYMSTTGSYGTLAGTTKSNWLLGIGKNFGVDSDGNLYANGGSFTGAVTATSGTFNNVTIESNCTVKGTVESAKTITGYLSADKITSGTLDCNLITVKNLTVTEAATAKQLTVTNSKGTVQVLSTGSTAGTIYAAIQVQCSGDDAAGIRIYNSSIGSGAYSNISSQGANFYASEGKSRVKLSVAGLGITYNTAGTSSTAPYDYDFYFRASNGAIQCGSINCTNSSVVGSGSISCNSLSINGNSPIAGYETSGSGNAVTGVTIDSSNNKLSVTYGTISSSISVSGLSSYGVITKSGSSNYFWASSSSGSYSSCSGIRLKLPDTDPYSDRRVKNYISDMPDMTNVYMNLKLHQFKYNQTLLDVDNLWHYGIIAQEVEENLNQFGYTLNDTSLIKKSNLESQLNEDKVIIDGSQIYRVRSEEFHAMHIQMIQKQQKQIETQANIISMLQGEIAIIKDRLKELEKC